MSSGMKSQPTYEFLFLGKQILDNTFYTFRGELSVSRREDHVSS